MSELDRCFVEANDFQGDLLDEDFIPAYVQKSSMLDELTLEQDEEVKVLKNTKTIIGFVEIFASNIQLRTSKKTTLQNLEDLVSDVVTNFRGSFVNIDDQELIQLVNEENGKVTYMKPPAKDANNNDIDNTKIYKVSLQRKKYSPSSLKYVLSPMEQKKYTTSDVDNVLRELAESL
jgi:hypothetical protein